MIKRHILATIALLLLGGGLTLLWFFCTPAEPEKTPQLHLSNQKANDDFTDLFRLCENHGDTLAHVTVTANEEVSDIVEKYDVPTTLYTKITATLLQDYTGRCDQKTVTILLMGNKENFPNREILEVENSYILRLEPWAHESGTVYLLNPLESTFLRVHENNVLVRDSAALPNYSPACSEEEFAKQYTAYCTENPADGNKLQQHYKEMIATLMNYDYQNKELSYHLEEQDIAKRLHLAKSLAEQ